jgi:hypothetical protein
MITKGKTELVNLQLNGSALNAFIDTKIDTEKFGIVIKDELVSKKKGKNDYVEPVFKSLNLTAEILKVAIEIDKTILQPYLKEYTKIQSEKEIEAVEQFHEAAKEDNQFERPESDEPDDSLRPLTQEEVDDLPF